MSDATHAVTNRKGSTALRQAALVGGLGLLLMSICAIGTIYFIFGKLIVQDDAAVTANNIAANLSQFRLGIALLVIVAILDVIVGWALYVFLAPVNRSLSLLAAWCRVVYAGILAVALFSCSNVLRLLSGADYTKSIEASQLHAEVMLSLKSFDDGWVIGLVLFGIHLALAGYLILKSDYVPKFVGALLVIAGLAYVIDSLGKILSANYALDLANVVGWGEVALMFWLLLRGVKVELATGR